MTPFRFFLKSLAPAFVFGAMQCERAGAQQTSGEAGSGAVTSLPSVTVRASAVDPGLLASSPASVGVMTVFGPQDLARAPGASLDDVVQNAGLGHVGAGGSFGLISGVGFRGFGGQNLAGVSSAKILLNGHPDIADAFNRDMSTVERVEVMSGLDSTFVGAGSPGGLIQYQTKRPTGISRGRVGMALATDGLRRLALDLEHKFSSLDLRVIAASQRGQTTVEGVPTDRDSVLLSGAFASRAGNFRLELEKQNNRLPFAFGLFHAADTYWYDRPYVSPQSTAMRDTSRWAVYWDNKIAESTELKAWFQQGTVRRKESLIGFWTVNTGTLLDGYYRLIDSSYDQQDVGVQLRHATRILGVSHRLTMLLTRQTQSLNFDGPENVAGYGISVQNPIWPVNVAGLALTPYQYAGKKTESGLALADTIQLSEKLQFRVGLRQSWINIDEVQGTIARARYTRVNHLSHSEGLSWQVTEAGRLWLSRAESFSPVLGLQRDRSVLPPEQATQWEAGYQHKAGSTSFALSAFHIVQINRRGLDLVNRNFFAPIGSVASRGMAMQGRARWLGVTWKMDTAFQSVRNTRPTSASQGPYVAGVPKLTASLSVLSDENRIGPGYWMTAFGASSRPADSAGSLYAPGFVRFDAGLMYGFEKWQLMASIHNAFDIRYIQSISASDNAWQGPRRVVSLSASVAFQ